MVVNFVLPHFGLKPTGGFKVVYEYANGLNKNGHIVNIIHPASIDKGIKGKVKYIKESNKKRNVDLNWKNINIGVNMIYTSSLKEKNIPDADIIIATSWETAVYVNNYSFQKGKKYYLIQHYETWNGEKEEVDKTWRYDMKKIVISKWLLGIGENLGCENLIYIPNALDHNNFKVNNDIKNRGNVISMMYSEVDWKGSIDGIRALIMAKKINPNIGAKLFGKYPRPVSLPKWIEYFENPTQDFLVNNIYNESSIFLCTSWREGWGLPPMEAMACGCAVITTNNGGVNDFAIHEKTSLVCNVKDYIKMCEYIIELTENDDKKYMIIQQGIEEVKKFTWEKSIKKLEKELTN